MSYELRRMILAEERHMDTQAAIPDSLDWFWFDNECPDGLTDSGKRFDDLKPGDVWAVWQESPIESVIEGRYYSIYEREADGLASHIIDLDNETDARAKLMALRLPAVAPEWLECLKEPTAFMTVRPGRRRILPIGAISASGRPGSRRPLTLWKGTAEGGDSQGQKVAPAFWPGLSFIEQGFAPKPL